MATPFPSPAFTTSGDYDLSTPGKQLAAAVACLRFVACCAQAYHGAGPAAVAQNMEHAARSFLLAFGEVASCDQCHSAEWVVGPPAAPSRLCQACYDSARALGKV